MRTVSIQQALERVAKNPELATDVLLDVPAHELICRALFEIANSPDAKVRGSMARATRAQKMILNRMVGTRRSGTHPATRRDMQIEFVDLTGGESK